MFMKKTRGFSYIEVMIAMALFAVAMLAVIPALFQAGRNMVYAEEAYASHLQAQRIMLTVRDALKDGETLQSRVQEHVHHGAMDFSVWVFGRHTQEFHTIDAPDMANASPGDMNVALAGRASTIVVIVWDENGHVSGRAVGMVYS